MGDIRMARATPGPIRIADYLPAIYAVASMATVLFAIALFAPRYAGLAPVAHPARRAAISRPQPAPAPVVPPTILADVTPDQARTSNAAFPFAPGKVEAARPFIYTGTPIDRSAALTCLAAAVYYEAGDDKVGEQAVAQVVLNRLRHPAFPKTVCGVVFQGSERGTGCQFTFTCDGAMRRIPEAAAWERAHAIAQSALTGFVAATVGTATHYHADYVVPRWRDSLAKIAVVGAHIFYRWPGGWGQRSALTGRLQPLEPIDPRLVALGGPERSALGLDMADDSVSMGEPPAPRVSLDVPGVSRAALRGSIVRLMDAEAAQYVLQLDPNAFEGSYAVAALAICKDKPDCLVMGWLSEDKTPTRLPVLPVGMRGMSFLYRKSGVLGVARPYWNCRQIHHPDKSECLPGTEP